MAKTKEKLLFVTKGGASIDDGFSYVLDLAKTLNAGISVLMVQGKKAMQTYEDVMAAVAFAEAGEHQTVREMMNAQMEEMEEAEARKIGELTERCRESSIAITCNHATGEVTEVVEEFIKSKPGIEMVFLSPSLSKAKGVRDIKKLLKRISRPIVTLARPEEAST